jgi:protein-disulfide isomerase
MSACRLAGNFDLFLPGFPIWIVFRHLELFWMPRQPVPCDNESIPEHYPGKVVDLSRIRLFACCLAVVFAARCPAQAPSPAGPATSVPANPAVDRRVETLIRSKFSVPPDYDLIIGGKTKSDIPDYDNLPVTVSHKGKQTTINFLISKDGNTLARLEKFDLSKDPALAIDVDGRPTRGDAAAKVEIINFDDLECPYCARMNTELSRETLDHYKGLVKIVYKDFPLQEIHPWAMHAAVDANCLAGLSAPAYWAYVDYLHSHADDISGAQHDPAKSFTALDNIAGTMGTQNKVDGVKLAACLKKQDEAVVRSSLKLGDSLGIEGTPQVFVNGERLPSGARPVEELWPAIDRALKAQGIQPPSQTPPAAAPDSAKPAKPGQ